ncbi:MAG: amino acid ABC transporter permease [Lachnospiraceae bacterium]|nr:amino acid ABC transporter permease [Lachnospiraceae bacterium]
MKLSDIFISVKNEKTPAWKAAFNYAVIISAAVLLVTVSLKRINVSLDYSFLAEVKRRLLQGFKMTLVLSAASLFFSLLIGIVSAVSQNSRVLLLRYFFSAYVKLIRGTPLLAQIYLFFYIIGTAWGIENRLVSGICILSVFEGAYISEIIRGSYLSMENKQIEIGIAIGLDRKGIIREIILPQMLSRTVPALTGQFASIIKDSSLLSVIAVTELAQTMREISSLNFKMFECYFLLAALYLLLTLPVTYFSEWLERKFGYEN